MSLRNKGVVKNSKAFNVEILGSLHRLYIMQVRSFTTHLRTGIRILCTSRQSYEVVRFTPFLTHVPPVASRYYSATQSQPSDVAHQPEVAGDAGGIDDKRRLTEFEAYKEEAEKTEASLRERIKEQEVNISCIISLSQPGGIVVNGVLCQF